MDESQLLMWAEREVQKIEADVGGISSRDLYSGVGSTSRALQFLSTHAPGSEFTKAAQEAKKLRYQRFANLAIAQALRDWISWVREGFVTLAPYEVRSRQDAATDLMEQVEVLLNSQKVHPAAPVVLAGAALEEQLRAMVTQGALSVIGKPGINSYGAALRTAEVISAQDLKDITSWAGLRNHAAHGEFDQVQIERARLMADGINLFMRKASA